MARPQVMENPRGVSAAFEKIERDRLDELARELNVTRSEVVRTLVREALARREAGVTAKD